MIDVVTPSRNEKAFLGMAQRLGYSELCLAYPFKGKDELEKKRKLIDRLQKKTSIQLHIGLIAGKNWQEMKNLADITLIHGQEENREILEKIKPSAIFDIEQSKRKDYTYGRNSGLDNITAKIAAKNRTIIIYTLKGMGSHVVMGRMRQNIRLCRKNSAGQAIVSMAGNPFEMRNPRDMAALFMVLGMTPGEAKKALASISEKIRENRAKRQPGYIEEGVQAV